MQELRQIVQLWQEGTAAALVTLVRAHGSSYRRPGARLLLGASARYAGTISGGCLEAELLRKASWLVEQGATVKRYSTALEDNGELPYGLGCGGTLDLLMERTETAECHALMTALADSLNGIERTIVTWLPVHGCRLQRAVFTQQLHPIFQSESLTKQDILCAQQWLQGDLHQVPDNVFLEHVRPPLRLFILGAGDDAKPLATIAAVLGWRIVVLDGRSQLAKAERFPEADYVRTAAAHSPELEAIGSADAVVIMTHSYEQDRAYLAAILPRRPHYLGVLGAHQRSALLIAETATELGWSLTDCCERIHAPVGLNLGGDGPEAIALAVVAQIQALCAGTGKVSTRLSAQTITAYINEDNRARYLDQDQCALNAG